MKMMLTYHFIMNIILISIFRQSICFSFFFCCNVKFIDQLEKKKNYLQQRMVRINLLQPIYDPCEHQTSVRVNLAALVSEYNLWIKFYVLRFYQ